MAEKNDWKTRGKLVANFHSISQAVLEKISIYKETVIEILADPPQKKIGKFKKKRGIASFR